MVAAGCNPYHVAQTRGDIGLPMSVISPDDHGPVRLECQTMVTARRDGTDIAQPGGHHALAILRTDAGVDCARAPTRYGSIGAQRKAVVVAGGKRRHIG